MPRAIVVGAGVVGLCCAYELQRRGIRVTLLDKGVPGAGCSQGNLGWITPTFSGPLPGPGVVRTSLKWLLNRDGPLYIKPGAIPELAGWLWDFWRSCNARDYRAGLEALAGLNRQTLALYDALEGDGVECELHRAGILFAFLSHAKMEHALEDLKVMQSLGFSVPQPIGGDDLRGLEPHLSPHVVGGFLVENERHVRPETLTAGLARRLTDMGAEMQMGVEVTGLQRRRAAIAGVVTAGGIVEGDHVLIAAGAWSGALTGTVGFRMPLQAGKGYSITIADPALRLRRPLYLDEARVGCSPFRGALRIGGTMELSGINTTLDDRRIAGIGRAADKYLVGWRRGAGEHQWVGMRPLTPDGLPVLGRVPGFDNLYVATGHGMLGVTLAPATAVAIAQLLTAGETDLDLRLFDPGRFTKRARHTAAS